MVAYERIDRKQLNYRGIHHVLKTGCKIFLVLIDYATRVSHRVTGVEMSGGQAQVSFANGELVLPASLVTSVREASSAPANSNTSSPDEESEAAA